MSAGGGIPSREESLRLLAEAGVPAHIQDHSVEVARIALRLARALNGKSPGMVDPALVEAGALLHDIEKMNSIESGGDHCAMGAETLTGLGLAELAPLVGRHVNLGPWDPDGPVTEVELVNYADKRVRHTEHVGLDERFHDLLERYGKSEKARERIREHWETVRALERKIFGFLDFPPEAI